MDSQLVYMTNKLIGLKKAQSYLRSEASWVVSENQLQEVEKEIANLSELLEFYQETLKEGGMD